MRRLLVTIAGLLPIALLCSFGFSQRPRTSRSRNEVRLQSASMDVHTRWSARPGVSRYRFQLAHDRKFNDILVDRIVNGTETDAGDLAPGRYFWRVAGFDGRDGQLGKFSPPQDVSFGACR